MNASTSSPRRAVIVAPTQGRYYSMGRMRAVFKADGAETDSRYSISEWWLEPNTRGPGTHAHPEDHIFFGTLAARGRLLPFRERAIIPNARYRQTHAARVLAEQSAVR